VLSKRTDNSIWIAPSLLSADFAHLADQIKLVERAGADLLHLDVMDGHFVPNLTIGPPVVKSIRAVTKLPFDVHLMITDPLEYAPRFAQAGADSITFHVEAMPDAKAAARQIASLGVSVGVSINPETPAESIFDVLEDVDLVLVMSVHPGFGGQEFMPEVLEKVKALRQRMRPDQWLQIDGGIDPRTIGQASAAGANCFVAGVAIFRADDSPAEIRKLRHLARQNSNV
jgi:ribulose-phosphate 3-epimerase